MDNMDCDIKTEKDKLGIVMSWRKPKNIVLKVDRFTISEQNIDKKEKDINGKDIDMSLLKNIMMSNSDQSSINSIYLNEKYYGYGYKTWCNRCKMNDFGHNKCLFKFIDKCIKIYNQSEQSKKEFFDTPYAHMLGTLLMIDNKYRSYLELFELELYKKYPKKILPQEPYIYVTNGIIKQYVERKYIIERNKTDIDIDFNKWLIMNNEHCDVCKHVLCPFHYDYGGIELVKISDNSKIKCCGWCYELLVLDKPDISC